MHLIGSIIRKKDNDERFIIVGKEHLKVEREMIDDFHGHTHIDNSYNTYELINFSGKWEGYISEELLPETYGFIYEDNVKHVDIVLSHRFHPFVNKKCKKFNKYIEKSVITKISSNEICEEFSPLDKRFIKEENIYLNISDEVISAISTYLRNEREKQDSLLADAKRLWDEYKPTEFPDEFKEHLIKIGKTRMNNIYYNLLLEKNMYPKDVIRIYESKLHSKNYKIGEVTSEVVNNLINKYSVGETKLKDGRESYLLFSRDDVKKMLIEFAALGRVLSEDREKYEG